MTLLAVACGQLKKENEQMKKENEKIKEENEEIKQHVKMLQNENTILKDHVHNATVPDSYPLLPIEVPDNNTTVHFYTGACGRHMSARMIVAENFNGFILLAFHKGKFDKYNPKIPNMFVKHKIQFISSLLPSFKVLDNTEAADELLPHDVLDTITGIDDMPPGVISRDIAFATMIKIYSE
uniref:Uncharacterized protein n=1 Tax=Amphimedon queenslandica TaxID=400682 RepID=A0A1X7SPY2_AMPQE